MTCIYVSTIIFLRKILSVKKSNTLSDGHLQGNVSHMCWGQKFRGCLETKDQFCFGMTLFFKLFCQYPSAFLPRGKKLPVLQKVVHSRLYISSSSQSEHNHLNGSILGKGSGIHE